jgi:hypothetical protein
VIDPHLNTLIDRVTRSSRRLRIAMGITAALCLLIAGGIASDASLWRSGAGWRSAAAVGVITFTALASLAGYTAIRGQRRHAARLRNLLVNHPQRVRSVSLKVARAVPNASWSPDNGSASGLHILISDDAGATWVLPVSRSESSALVAGLARRCPNAVVEP